MIRFRICSNLHAMSDVGFSDSFRDSREGNMYSRPHTNNAECYAEKCTNRGRCLIAVDENLQPINKKTQIG